MVETTFGAWLREQREAAGLTQLELAMALFVDPTTLSRWERGVDPPSRTQARVRAWFAEHHPAKGKPKKG